MRTPHTSTNKGKRIFVKLRNGETFIDKFVDKKSGKVIFENHIVNISDLKVFSINKNK